MPKASKTGSFPVGRIKRIMQADEDIGKVAVACPLVVCKALELFIAELTESAVNEARERGSKKVGLHHLKRAILSEPNFDFLKDFVSTIPDIDNEASEGKSKGKKAVKSEVPNKSVKAKQVHSDSDDYD